MQRGQDENDHSNRAQNKQQRIYELLLYKQFEKNELSFISTKKLFSFTDIFGEKLALCKYKNSYYVSPENETMHVCNSTRYCRQFNFVHQKQTKRSSWSGHFEWLLKSALYKKNFLKYMKYFYKAWTKTGKEPRRRANECDMYFTLAQYL